MGNAPWGGILLTIVGLAGLFGSVHARVYQNAEHAGKWAERCRHTTCADGLPKWGVVDGRDACVCITTAKKVK